MVKVIFIKDCGVYKKDDVKEFSQSLVSDLLKIKAVKLNDRKKKKFK